MKKLCIYSFYDSNGIVDEYIFYCLQGIIEAEYEVCFVSNGTISPGSRKRIEKFATKIMERKNVGFDAGGYKEALSLYYSEGKIEGYQELLLINDTFYGPFKSWTDIFSTMDLCDADFWGIVRVNTPQNELGYLLSFLLVFRSKVIHSEAFKRYWEDLVIPETYLSACQSFEQRISRFLVEHGFKCSSYLERINSDFFYDGINKNYIVDAKSFLLDYGMPIIKRKALVPPYCINFDEIITCIKSNFEYDTDLIESNIKRVDEVGGLRPIGYKSLKVFLDSFENIYIYGNGYYARIMRRYLNALSFKYSGHIVTNGECESGVIAVDKVELQPKDGIIVCVSEKNWDEIFSRLSKRIQERNVLFIRF